MKRKYASQVISSMSQNMRNLTKGNLAGHFELFPTLSTAVLKLKMYIHARYLNKVFLWFAECNFENLANNESAVHLKALYNEVSEEYFDQKLWNSILTFNEFWNILIKKKQIDENELHNYYHAKMQTCIIWQAMNVLYNPVEVQNTDYYIIKPDEYDDELPIMNCGNTKLEKAFSLMTSNEYIPVKPEWKNSQEPALVRPILSLSGLEEGKVPLDSFAQLGDKTLGDVWEDYTIFVGMSYFALKKPVMMYHVENNLAQALADLMDIYLSTLEVIGGEVDFLGNVWEEDAATQAEIEQLRKFNNFFQEQLPKKMENLSSISEKDAATRAYLAHAVEMYREKEWEAETVYSQNKIENLREMGGEMLRDAPIIMPNRKQKQEYPDCRWIIQCSRRKDGKITGVEKPVSLWNEFCQYSDIGFWARGEFIDGLYVLLDGELIKGIKADPKIENKIRNAFNNRSFYKPEEELFEDILRKIR